MVLVKGNKRTISLYAYPILECTEHCSTECTCTSGGELGFCNFDYETSGYCEYCSDVGYHCEGFITNKGKQECKKICEG